SGASGPPPTAPERGGAAAAGRAASGSGRPAADSARQPNGGLIVVGGAPAALHRGVIIPPAARYRLPAIYSDPVFITEGGLIAYGPDRTDQYRCAASYVDRILKGEKPADLPVQASTKYQLVINLK